MREPCHTPRAHARQSNTLSTRVQTLKGARPIVDGVCTRFTLLKLALERAVLAYYLYIGRMDSVESKICKLYMTVQQIHDPYHCALSPLPLTIPLCALGGAARTCTGLTFTGVRCGTVFFRRVGCYRRAAEPFCLPFVRARLANASCGCHVRNACKRV